MKTKTTQSNKKPLNKKDSKDSKPVKIQGDVWDLEDVLGTKTSEQHISDLKVKIEAFKKFRDKLNDNISNETFREILLAKEQIKKSIARLMHYYNLKFFENNADSATLAKLTLMNQMATEWSNDIIFFALWFMRIDDKVAKRLMSDKSIIKYLHYLETVRIMRPYTKSEEIEQISILRN